MSQKQLGDRRGFVRGAGAALLAPLAMGTVAAAVGETGEADSARLHAQLQRLEATAQLRSLHGAYLRHFNAGEHDRVARLFVGAHAMPGDGISRLSAAAEGMDEGIEFSVDGRRARVRLPCTAQVATAIGPDCTLLQMARQQGGGVTRRTEARVLESDCVSDGTAWKIASLTVRPA